MSKIAEAVGFSAFQIKVVGKAPVLYLVDVLVELGMFFLIQIIADSAGVYVSLGSRVFLEDARYQNKV